MTHAVVHAILTAIPAIQAERARLHSERGVTRPPDHRLTQMPPENVRRTELRTRLLSFDDESLLKAEALYYYGRDRDGTFREKLDDLRRRGEPKEWIVSTLLEKLPAWEMCFAHAQADLRKEGLSLETV
jgi:hypothetical protein